MKKFFIFPLIILLMLAIANTAYAADENLPNIKCLSCHGDSKFSINRLGKEINISVDPSEFSKSIHGTNSCTSCHTDIVSVPHKDPLYGAEQKIKINERCMACHTDVTNEYLKSIHGSKQKAFCSDCHGSHNIRKKSDPQSLANRVNISKVCMNCHQGEVKEAYLESFHGKANSLGSKRAASCADCHGSHAILGQSDPASLVSKTQTPKTCAKCHLVPRENFAGGMEHYVLENKPGMAPMYWTFKFFIWLTIIVISLLFVHMELELYRLYKKI